MKRLLIVLVLCFMFTGCATVSHKDIETKWAGFGVNIDYKSSVAIPPEKIPAFIMAVNKLEVMLIKLERLLKEK